MAPYPETNSYWAGEVAMDLDVISAVCPSCHLVLAEADDTQLADMGTAVNTVVRLGATSVVDGGTSFDEPDELQFDDAYFNHPGVTITAPSGDYAYSNGTGTPYPAVSPDVIAVGGTSLTRDPDAARGWDESAWSQSGSGCSKYEPKPTFQHDQECAGTTAADVSAVADPATGVAAYDSYQADGWTVMGGTGGAAAIVAGIAALAGPGAGSAKGTRTPLRPRSTTSPRAAPGTAAAPTCARPDRGTTAPTGLGSPRGVLAFAPPDHHGDVVGAVTDETTGAPLPEAVISADGTTVTSDAQGRYDLALTVGSHDVTATAFGHRPMTANAVSVRGLATTTQNLTLAALPSATLSGTVTDGSGHGWPVYAKIDVARPARRHRLHRPAHRPLRDRRPEQQPGDSHDRAGVRRATPMR